MGLRYFAVMKVPPPLPLRNPFAARPRRNPVRFSVVMSHLLFVNVYIYIITRIVNNVNDLGDIVSHILNTVEENLTRRE